MPRFERHRTIADHDRAISQAVWVGRIGAISVMVGVVVAFTSMMLRRRQ